jgi:6-phospho-3-hexuloisomerase
LKPELTMQTLREMSEIALTELGQSLSGVDPAAFDRIVDEVMAAKTVVCFGLGREGLMIRAFCMRLMHLGFDAHVAGDVTAPPIGPGDLLLTSSGPGDLLLVRSMIELAHRAGARVVLFTAQPDGPDPRGADAAIVIPAQTMANDRGSESMLPMGTAYEISLLILLDLAALGLRERTGQTMAQLRARHSNLE